MLVDDERPLIFAASGASSCDPRLLGLTAALAQGRGHMRGLRLQQRVKLMTWWGEQLVCAERGADVVQ